MCRNGWQRHIINEATQILDGLRAARAAAGGAAGGKPGGKAPGGAAIPVTIDLPWMIELTLNLAFGLEDAGKDADAQKKADEANQLLDELMKESGSDPAVADRNTRLRQLVWNARAYFYRKAPGKAKDDIVKASGSTVLGAALFVLNGATTSDAAAEELLKAWATIDADFDLRAAVQSFSTDPRAPRPDGGQVVRGNVKPQSLIDLALALRATCVAKQWPLALCMICRLEKFQMPPGRGRILLDLSKAECEVWHASTVKKEDPTSKMLLSAADQEQREVETRHRSVKLVEQCIMIARRIEAYDLVEECAVVMWNIARELMSDQNRFRVHKPLQSLSFKDSKTLFAQRILLVVASDLLTKGYGELQRANTLDYTVTEAELPDTVRPLLNDSDPSAPPLGRDPAHYLRRFDEATEEPSDVADQVMLLLDQVTKVKGAKNEKGEIMPLSEEKKRLNYNLLVQAFEKLEAELEALIGNERLQGLSETFEPPPRHILSHEPLKPLPFQANATVSVGGGPAVVDGKPILDKRPKSEKEEAVRKAKRIVKLMCQCGLEAKRAEEGAFAVQVCSAMDAANLEDLRVGPWPTEAESALLLTQAAYTKAQCLSWDIEDQGLLNGIDEEIEEEKEAGGTSEHSNSGLEAKDGEEEEVRELTAEEKAQLSEKKREMIRTLQYGIELSNQFGQHWMVANGLVHFWNLHLDTVGLSHDNPKLLKRALQEYRDALRDLQKYLTGPSALPDSEFDPKLAANLTLAYINAHVGVGSLEALETANLLTLKRLGPCERKEIMARIVQVCKENEKPLPDVTQLKTQEPEPVSVCVLDAETVSDSHVGTDQTGDSFNTRLCRLCYAIQKLQESDLSVIVVSEEDIKDPLRAVSDKFLQIDMKRLLYIKAYNAGYIDTIRTAADYEAFYATNADLREIDADWRIPPKIQRWLRENQELHVSFSFDASGAFHPHFAQGVIPGFYSISIAPTTPAYCGGSARDLDGWTSDFGDPQIALRAVMCGENKHKVLALFALDEKDPLLQMSFTLSSKFSVEEVEFMRDWQYPVRVPGQWEGLPHVVHVVAGDLKGLWVLGVGSRKVTRRRAGKLALAVMEKALNSGQFVGNGEIDEQLQSLVERVKLLLNIELRPVEAESEPTPPVASPASEAKCFLVPEEIPTPQKWLDF
ncbi:Uncharacterized protein SCF082_LOCUS52338 [Durusdinium trenchii]|uniref:Uncharacterized protein n=1 Tax=Durusdinium trenchii TaxID=1381693 RepID=A0ABP0SKG5_9DINO